MSHEIIDISASQHPYIGTNADGSGRFAPIDYKATVEYLLAQGVETEPHVSGNKPLVIIKLTELSSAGAYVNPFAEADINGFRDAGAAVAGYLFFHPAVDVDKQVQLALANRHGVDWILVDSEVDTELPLAQTAEATHNCVTALTWNLVNSGVYADFSDIDAWGAESWGVPIALAEWGVSKPDAECVLWQTGSVAPVPGIQGPVDHDVWFGTEKWPWDKFFPAPKPTPKPDPNPPLPDGETYPRPNHVPGKWALATVAGAEASFYLVNLVAGTKHTFGSNEAGVYAAYKRADYPVVDISIKVAQDLQEV